MLIPKSFLPEDDIGSSALHIELPPGVQLEETSAASAAAYRIIARQPEVADVVESVGDNDEGVRSAELDIALVPAKQRHVTQRQFEDRVLKLLRVIPDAQHALLSQRQRRQRHRLLHHRRRPAGHLHDRPQGGRRDARPAGAA